MGRRQVTVAALVVAARQPLIVPIRYVLDDGEHREVWLIGSTGLEESGQ